MKIIKILMIFTLVLTTSALAQKLEPYGLQGKTTTALAFYGGSLYAGADCDGLFVRKSPDSSWNEIGLKGVNIRSVYPHDIGPIGWGITVGTEPESSGGDSALTYCWSIYDPQWVISDSNLNRNRISIIHAFDGFPDPRI